MTAERDVWLEGGIVWAAPNGNLAEEASRDLTRRALALAEETANWRILFDFRRSKLTHDVLALNRQAELLSQHGLPAIARTAMLCRHRSTDFQFWERVLTLRGLAAATFTDGEAAIGWLQVSPQADDSAEPGSDSLAPRPIDLAAVKRQLRQFAEQRRHAPREEVAAEFRELMEYVQTQAGYLGVDAVRGLEQQLRDAVRRSDD
ncbi:MAG TPA: hypothetical protein VMT49_00640 [Steroidobacteraceae bacterium]|nr:hypothetical protein [Steroidobacteraceae bacterium]